MELQHSFPCALAAIQVRKAVREYAEEWNALYEANPRGWKGFGVSAPLWGRLGTKDVGENGISVEGLQYDTVSQVWRKGTSMGVIRAGYGADGSPEVTITMSPDREGALSIKRTLTDEIEQRLKSGSLAARPAVPRGGGLVTADGPVDGPTTAIGAPIEITRSLAAFRRDHPDPAKVGFIMMRFGGTRAHNEIAQAIKDTLAVHGLEGVRADDRQYASLLLLNVQTYMHGCGFGVAVFERIESDEFNPNVGLEVGYMMALRKEVCLLKDSTLKALQTDLLGAMYRPFDTQDVARTVPQSLEAWLRDMRII